MKVKGIKGTGNSVFRNWKELGSKICGKVSQGKWRDLFYSETRAERKG